LIHILQQTNTADVLDALCGTAHPVVLTSMQARNVIIAARPYWLQVGRWRRSCSSTPAPRSLTQTLTMPTQGYMPFDPQPGLARFHSLCM
jgi:hypothetical protein